MYLAKRIMINEVSLLTLCARKCKNKEVVKKFNEHKSLYVERVYLPDILTARTYNEMKTAITYAMQKLTFWKTIIVVKHCLNGGTCYLLIKLA